MLKKEEDRIKARAYASYNGDNTKRIWLDAFMRNTKRLSDELVKAGTTDICKIVQRKWYGILPDKITRQHTL